MPAARGEVEEDVRRRCEGGDVQGAVTAVIRGYGPDLMGFMHALSRQPTDAGDAFADLCVRMWKSLPGFRWDSTLWTWTHVLARRALHAQHRRRIAWDEQHVRISDIPAIDALIVEVRTTALARMRGEPTRAERLRRQLSAEEQELLILRVDRGLAWREIAQVLGQVPREDDADADAEAELGKAAAALRKRFERLTEKLRRLAAEEP
jgi:RNA polymerase sigma-70 factor (ECF subfamily)